MPQWQVLTTSCWWMEIFRESLAATSATLGAAVTPPFLSKVAMVQQFMVYQFSTAVKCNYFGKCLLMNKQGHSGCSHEVHVRNGVGVYAYTCINIVWCCFEILNIHAILGSESNPWECIPFRRLRAPSRDWYGSCAFSTLCSLGVRRVPIAVSSTTYSTIEVVSAIGKQQQSSERLCEEHHGGLETWL